MNGTNYLRRIRHEAKLYRNEWSIQSLACKFGLTEGTILRDLRICKVKLRPTGKFARVSAARINSLKELIQRGNTLKEISKIEKRTGQLRLVRKYLPDLLTKLRQNAKSRMGKYLRRNRHKNSAKLRKALKLSELGYGVDAIGKKLGIHGTTVMLWLRKELGAEYKIRHNRRRFRGGPKCCWVNLRGDRLQSSYEEKVADYLHKHGIRYVTQTSLKIGGKWYYPDFYLPDSNRYIEVLGLTDLRFYRDRVKIKKAAYEHGNINCYFLDKSAVTSEKVPEEFVKWLKQ